MTDSPNRPAKRRGLDPLTLLFGIGALLVSGAALTNGSGLLPDVDPRWLLAGGAVLVGLLLLIGTMRGGSRNSSSRDDSRRSDSTESTRRLP